VKTSVNQIGAVINCSQHISSQMWHQINNGKPPDECMDMYMDVCKLAVLSNIEINFGLTA